MFACLRPSLDRRPSRAARVRRLARLLPALFLLAGCGKISRLMSKPPPEGVTSQTSTTRMIGYEETVTLKATPADFLALMSNPANLTPGGIEMELQEAAPGGTAALGSTSPFNLKRLGLEIKGKLIFIKVDPDKIWMIWDNPFALQIQRWEFSPVKEGLRLTLKVDTELSSDPKWAPLEGTIEKLNEEIFKELDLMLARMQAHFDPSLDPAKLVAVGLRGESYESLLEVYQSETWMKADVSAARAWVTDPANAGWYGTYFDVANSATAAVLNAPLGTVTYTPLVLHTGALRVPCDCFMVQDEEDRGSLVKAYFVTYGYVSLLTVDLKPEAGGVAVKGQYRTEVPAAMSPQGMDLVMAGQGVPQMLQDRVLALKNGVEQAK